jgi:hypothetical protein
MQSAQARADRLSQFATYLSNPFLLNEEVDRFARVTVADINAFASRRLVATNRASLLYAPRQNGEAAA